MSSKNRTKYKKTLGIKIALWASLVLMVIFFTITGTNFIFQKSLMKKKEMEAARIISSTIKESIRFPMLMGDQDVIQRQFDRIKENNPEMVIHILNNSGEIRFSTETGLVGQQSEARVLHQALEGEEIYGIEFRKKSGFNVYSELNPISNEEECTYCHDPDASLRGVLRFAKDYRPTEKAIPMVRKRNIIISLSGLAAAVILIILVSRRMLKPLGAVVYVTKEIAKGDLTKSY